tara:strand:- start:3613 stop:4098 length:486 start_codon:yes stop_codon:yes gene_type:complete
VRTLLLKGGNSVTNSFSVSEVLFSLQDKMTVNDTLTAEHRSFYTTFRGKLEAASDGILPSEVLELMNQTRSESEGIFSDEEFNGFVSAVLSKINTDTSNQTDSDAHLTVESGTSVPHEASPEEDTRASRSIFSRFQSLSVGVLAIIGAATVLSFVMFYLTL